MCGVGARALQPHRSRIPKRHSSAERPNKNYRLRTLEEGEPHQPGGSAWWADFVIAFQDDDLLAQQTDQAAYGSDYIAGGGGDDMIFGNSGRDKIYGDGGNDRISGGPGTDLIHGGSGDDEIRPDAGNDHVFAGPGNDNIHAFAGGDFDYVDCGPGYDTAFVDKGERTRRCERVKHR